ncbi:MAG TPA: penicillin acylase family protein [Chitinophagaceae bacterium]|nr:penicillin acylase family protein [Chitinophagaceae bacterium]
MKWFRVCCSGLVTLGLVILLSRWWSPSLPPLGRLFSPQEGFWQNASPVSEDFSGNFSVPGLQDSATVWLDKQLVPHIFARNEHDLYFLQGYITARFRLWQMELQVRAAAGRVSEILGPETLSFDRLQRRKGMVTAAKKAVAVMENNPVTAPVINAYTAGVNAWISTLDYRKLPLEYKLLGYYPSPWTPLKCALLIKYMSDMLTGEVNARENTNARNILSASDFDRIYPDFYQQQDPIVPVGMRFDPPVSSPHAPKINAPVSGFVLPDPIKPENPGIRNGSNNWAVNGKMTRSGVPILCNDPHLDLNLPSLWFEVQLVVPGMDANGVSLPGSPGVIIGFNDSIAWGETNAERDVKDYYTVRFRDSSRRQYRWENGWKNTDLHIECIQVRDQQPFYDTVAYTFFGPVTYDASFPDPVTGKKALASRWTGGDSSNEALCIYMLNHAHNYADYLQSLQYFDSPGQNFAYADKDGNIAIWEQGKFPLLWKGQGKFIMSGEDSSNMWEGFIPYRENPHVFNPVRNFVSSANEQPTDSTYPYYYSGDFKPYRAHRINQVLSQSTHITIKNMEELQTDVYNTFASQALPLMLRELKNGASGKQETLYLDTLGRWNLYNEPYFSGPSLFQLWWDSLYADVWAGYYRKVHMAVPRPQDIVTIELLSGDSALHFLKDIPPPIPTLAGMDLDAFHKAMKQAGKIDLAGQLEWGKFQGTDIMHLAKLPAFSDMHLFTGGGAGIVNATKKTHGPSWRMVVELSSPIRAYGIYPGGQDGNPGSKYYDNMVKNWVMGKYYRIHVLDQQKPGDPAVRYRMSFEKK